MHFEFASWAHPDTWPPCEMMVSGFFGFTLQRTFVSQWFAPIFKEAHAQVHGMQVCALQSSSSACTVNADHMIVAF